MKTFYDWTAQFAENYWNYVPAKWWHIKWRGGKFIMIRDVTHHGTHVGEDHYLKCLDAVFEFDSGDGVLQWDLETYVDNSRIYEITTLRFKFKNDSLMFKLEYA